MQNIKLIACDLDGTLLHSDKSISDYTIKVLEECRSRGIMIAFATARSERGAIRAVAPFTPDFIISSGGAKITRGEKVIFSSKMSPEIVRDIIAMCRRFTGGRGEITVETDSGHFWDYKIKPQDDTVESNCYYTDFENFAESRGVLKIEVGRVRVAASAEFERGIGFADLARAVEYERHPVLFIFPRGELFCDFPFHRLFTPAYMIAEKCAMRYTFLQKKCVRGYTFPQGAGL